MRSTRPIFEFIKVGPDVWQPQIVKYRLEKAASRDREQPTSVSTLANGDVVMVYGVDVPKDMSRPILAVDQQIAQAIGSRDANLLKALLLVARYAEDGYGYDQNGHATGQFSAAQSMTEVLKMLNRPGRRAEALKPGVTSAETTEYEFQIKPLSDSLLVATLSVRLENSSQPKTLQVYFEKQPAIEGREVYRATSFN